MMRINFRQILKLLGCALFITSGAVQAVSIKKVGVIEDKKIMYFTLTNSYGMEVVLTNWGAYVVSIKMPDKKGNIEEVTVGYEDWKDYFQDTIYAGPIVGRFANRIANGRFEIDGTTYQVTKNNGGPENDLHHLHGGEKGLQKRVWKSKLIKNGVSLFYRSIDGEEGYPGNLDIQVSFTLEDNNQFRIKYTATTDKKTPVNLTSHMYFNLTGNLKDKIDSHKLFINADYITPVDKYLIPNGKLMDVSGTPFDFRVPKFIKSDIQDDHEQLVFGGGQAPKGGYDHNFVLTDWDSTLKSQAILVDPQSGRALEIMTTEPGLQFYSGNFMDGSVTARGSIPIRHRMGLALEPQHFPDSPNQAHFPNTIIAPGDLYESETVYRFYIEK